MTILICHPEFIEGSKASPEYAEGRERFDLGMESNPQPVDKIISQHSACVGSNERQDNR